MHERIWKATNWNLCVFFTKKVEPKLIQCKLIVTTITVKLNFNMVQRPKYPTIYCILTVFYMTLSKPEDLNNKVPYN